MSIKSIKKLLCLIGLCILFAGCSTGRYNVNWGSAPVSNTDRGMRYLLGRGVQADNEKALYYFEKAAKENDAFAENELGFMYAAGKGVPPNNAKALYWYQKAANQGLASAQYNLGLMYLHGLGTAPDKAKALLWIQKSAASGFEPAKVTLAKLRS